MNYKIDWPLRGHNYNENEIKSISDLLRKNDSLTQGQNVKEFEDTFSSYIGSDHSFATMSCAHSLDIAAMLIKIKPGDEVIIPAHTYCATALAFARRGAKIKWADIDEKFWTICPNSISRLISKKTKAIVLVHLYGLINPHIEEIVTLAKNNSIYLIEDCAQSLGAHKNNKHCGTFGDIGCFSFHAQKNLTTIGEGGMIITQNSKWADNIKGLRINGHAPFPDNEYYWLPAMVDVKQNIKDVWPIKSTMNEAQGILGKLLLNRLDELTSERRSKSNLVRKALEEYPLRFQKIPKNKKMHSHHLLPAIVESKEFKRDDIINILSQKFGIKAIVQFYPLNRYDLFIKNGFGKADIPITDHFFDNMISFPFSLIMSEKDFDYLIESTKNIFN